MFKTLALAAIATVALTSFAEAQQRGYGQRGGGYGYQQRGGYNQAYRGGNYNNSFNRNVNRNVYVKNNGWGGGNGAAWAAGGLALGAVIGALAAQPSYAAPQYAPAPVGVVPGINNVPGCYYAAFVDVYGRQFFRQICN